MEFTKHQATMQQHTTTIVLSTHKSSITSPTTSPELDSAPILHSPSPPKESRGKHKERRHNNRERKEKKDQDTKEKKGKKENSKKERQNRIYKLPKEVLKRVCDQLTFEEMFVCAAVSKKMAKKFYRILTSHKKCSSIEKKDLRILLDPSALEAGITFYRVANNYNNNNNNNDNNNKYSILEKSYLQEIENKEKNIKREISKNVLTNTICHNNSGQVAYHLKQLEHMLIYNTVNGNEVVRVANNWIFFNRRLFIKINNTVAQSAPVDAEDDRLCLVDIVVVEANLCRKAKSSFFGRAATPAETFCQINLDNLHLRTSVTSQEVDPIWNEDSSFVVKKNTSYKLQISMLEYGKLGRHTLLGQVEISLKDLASNVVHDIWQSVQSTEENFSGNFHVMIHKSPVPKKEVDTRTLGMLGHFGAISRTVPLRLEEGDIVLISNSEFYTHIAKLGTLSVWDHVAMVVSRHGELHLFESTPDGVFTSPLDRRLKFYLQASTLGFRRLTIERTASMKKNLKSFIKEVDGRPYKQNWMDLVRAWQGSHTSEDLSSIFCSELVAAAYKRMGLLDNKISSNNFLPVDFALPNNNKVKLLQGRLEKIRMIYAFHSDD